MSEPNEPNEPNEHEAYEADFSDYYEKTLAPARMKELDAHLASCEHCKAEYGRFREAIGTLSGLHKVPAPPRFEESVAQKINKRSAGRFFGRKAFGDRVPFEVLAIVGLAIVLAVFLLMRFSGNGSVHEPLNNPDPPPGKDIKNVVPVP
jgi:anti-sigma factor RsiW